MSDIFLCADRRLVDGQIQLSICDDNGGFRIAGPKYDGRSESLLRHKLSKRDRDEIILYLGKVG